MIPKHIPKLLPLLILLFSWAGSPGELHAQGATPYPPDCFVFFQLTTSGTAQPNAGFDNRFVGCTTWTLSYFNVASGFSGLTLTVQSAPAGTTIGVAGTFGTYAGTVITGVNPNTSTTGAETTFNNGTVSIPWIRVRLSATTGTGTVFGTLQGWTSGHSGSTPSGTSGCVGTAGTPCVVDGPTASGAPPTTPPVLVAGQDGTNLETLKTDVNGRLIKGAYPTTAALTVSASGLTRIITAGAGTTTIGHISLSFASSTDFQLEYGTGTNCGTGTTALSGLYKSILAIALDEPFIVPAAKDLCINLGTAVTGGGLAIYATP